MRILSTKKLKSNQKQFLLNAGLTVIEADFILTTAVPFEIDITHDYLLFTSQNAVESVLQNGRFETLKDKSCFCVGIKTKDLLERLGFQVIEFTDYASELAAVIVKKYPTSTFTFFSGNIRRDTLPEALRNGNITFNEITVYETHLTSHKITPSLDGILFYSPSGIDSYLKENQITNEMCICIGTTTASALEGITENIVLANQPTVENVIIQTLKYFNKNVD
ncbi:uroporphyrinogen-III synthase [Flavobacterium sp. '19STA2R22 D10 B1']|uniref:uroporphyrinogen-III synthase n=1 Tax=Flavobacterium aerium TaxID=3037261 RepID=UPI00278C4731|nr:uroporphyrinogen-III synthase [Flavobacterium sp. '19STA2R22 D10 B1']